MERIPKILVVDDEQDITDFIKEILSANSEVVSAVSGEEALGILEGDASFDVVLIDVLMPGMNGLELLRKIKGNPGTTRIRAIILTILSGVQDKVEALAIGADDYVAKPFEAAELIARVQTQIRLKQIEEGYEENQLKAREDLEVCIKQRTDELNRQWTFLRQVIDTDPTFIAVKDRLGRYTLVNEAFARANGMTPDEMIGRTGEEVSPSRGSFDALHRDNHQIMDGLYDKTRYVEQITFGDGCSRWLETTVRPIANENGGADHVLIVMQDITKRRQALDQVQRRLEVEKTLALISGRFVNPLDFNHILSESLKDVGMLSKAARAYLFLVRTGREIIDCTHEWCADGVISQIDQNQNLSVHDFSWIMKKMNAGEVVHLPDVSKMPAEAAAEKAYFEKFGVSSILAIPLMVGRNVVGFVGLDGVEGTPGWTEPDIEMLQVVAEIFSKGLRQWWMEEDMLKQRAFLRQIIDSVPNQIVVRDWNGRFVLANTAAAKEFYGKQPKDLIGKSHIDLKPGDYELQHLIQHEDRIVTKTLQEFFVPEVKERDYLGNEHWYQIVKRPVFSPGGEADLVLCVMVDITKHKQIEMELSRYRDHLEQLVAERTVNLHQLNEDLQRQIQEREHAEELIRNALVEKDTLLKEIHHRVKNNLQIIFSLLELQADKERDEKALAALIESRNRVHSISLVHEHLYQSENMARVDFSQYLISLAAYMRATYRDVTEKINFVTDAERIELPIDIAVPCGLIANELVSNAYQHAFPGKVGGNIRLSIKHNKDLNDSSIKPGQALCPEWQGDFIMMVQDDGIGLPPEVDFSCPTTLGLQLVNMLVEQIGGKIVINRGPGANYWIGF